MCADGDLSSDFIEEEEEEEEEESVSQQTWRPDRLSCAQT
jgi:hypothetical protein